MGCQNGSQVDQYLWQSMSSYNMSLEPGFCKVLNKGILVCQDDGLTPKKFTIFRTPHVNDEEEEEEEENINLLKLAIQEKLDNKDLCLLTKINVTIPVKTSELRHHIKTYRGCVGRILGQKSLVFVSFTTIYDHIEEKETSYNYEFKQDKLFGGNFLDRIN